MSDGTRARAPAPRGAAAAGPDPRGSNEASDGPDAFAEQALRERVAAGDRAAYAEAVERFAPRLLGLCRRIVLDPAAAEDIVQETLFKLWTERATLSGRSGSVLPWLRRVATNASLNWCERERLRSGPAAARLLRDAVGPPPEHRAGGAGASPLRAAAESEARERVALAMAALPPERRVVLALRVFEEMSYDEIATTLSIAPGTVMSRLHRARLELRERLADLDPGGPQAARDPAPARAGGDLP